MYGRNSESQIKVSIIVPVYNVKNYLCRCIDSLLAQTMEEIEIILIDDCSTDGSIDIIREYEDKYTKVKGIYLPENHCLGGARNAGLRAADGEYVTFVDSDDWIEAGMCRDLYEKALAEGSDIVFGQYQLVNEENRVTGIRSFCFQEQLDIKDKKTLKELMVLNPHYAWGKIIRKNVLTDNNLYFPEHIFFEDIPVIPLLPLYTEKISLVDRPFYNYFQRNDSISRGYTKQKIMDEINCSNFFLDECRNRGFFEKYKETIILKYFISVYFYPMQHMAGLPETEKEELTRKIFSLVNDFIPELCKNPFLELYTSNEVFRKISGDTLCGIKNNEENSFADYIGSLRNAAVWGAGKKGMDFLRKYSAAATDSVPYVIDKNEKLWGSVVESGQEIINFYDHIDGIDNIIVANRNYYNDILNELKEHGIRKNLINYEIELPIIQLMNVNNYYEKEKNYDT